jgi:thiamine-phosphate pyrophosphorylase
MLAAIRIIDANFNRSREALRTLEDIARFSLESESLSSVAKDLRHRLSQAVRSLPTDHLQLLACRDTQGDVGTTITATGEFERASLADVAAAASARLSEALRSMEEACKCLSGSAAEAIESVRYASYTFSQSIALSLGGKRAPQWKLCVLLTESLCAGRPWLSVAQAAISGGADCLQLREKLLDSGELLARAKSLVAIARPANVAVIVNDRPDIALLSGANGVHVGQSDLSVQDIRRLCGKSLLVGVSTSNAEQMAAASLAGADYCGIGPMFPTTTKHKPVIAGPEVLKQCGELHPAMPHLAIGGITPDNIGLLRDVGCKGVAVSSCVCGDANPDQVCRSLRQSLGR